MTASPLCVFVFVSLLQRPLKRTDTDHDCPTHDTCLCHTGHAGLYNMFPLQAGRVEV